MKKKWEIKIVIACKLENCVVNDLKSREAGDSMLMLV